MRFGKKRGLIAAGHKASKQVQPLVPDSGTGLVDTASLPLQPEEEEVVSVQDDISQVSGDPIQQLFTTLGKFHRQLNKAQHAPDGEGWCDECMNELMTGLEISIAREWTPIKDALIDTARVLHSYEQAGRAGQCVPFLKDSYELLSLMVGDLIVDTVRAGVKQKWREHYMRAVEELESRGIALVEDEEREVIAHAPTVAPKPPEPAKVPPVPAFEDVVIQSQETDQEKKEDTPAVSDDTPAAASEKLAARLDDVQIELPPLSDEFSLKAPEQKEERADDIVPFPPMLTNDETPYEEPQKLHIVEEEGLFKPDSIETPEVKSLQTKNVFVGAEDTLFPDKEGGPDSETAGESAVAPNITEQEETPEEEKPTEELSKQEAPEDEVKADQTVDEAAHEPAIEKPGPAETVNEKTPPTQESKTVRKETDEHVELLQRVQAAISSGDTRNTKAMALELAVAMARLEYEQARQELAETEQSLLENGRFIEQGEAKVRQMENDLLRAEELLSAREGDRNNGRERVAAIDEELSGLSAGLTDIDAQIAALQQKRVEQENLIRNKQAEREESIEAESRIQTELEALGQELDSIRDNLENANAEVRKHHAERRNIELDIIKVKEEMEARRQSLSIIENTLQRGSAAPVKAPDTDTLL